MITPTQPTSGRRRARTCARRWNHLCRSLFTTIMAAVLGTGLLSCVSTPLNRYSTDTPPMILTRTSKAGVLDGRARFREIFCAIPVADRFSRESVCHIRFVARRDDA